jgi:hypothetical protein
MNVVMKRYRLIGRRNMFPRSRFLGIGMFIATVLVIAVSIGAQQANQPKAKGRGILSLPGEELKVRLVEIQDEQGINPKVLVSGKGTTVIWYNTTDGPIHIRFQRGDSVRVACAEPKHFVVQEDGSFQSDEIPFGGSASLCFIESGNYEYVVTGVTAKPFKTGGRFNKLGTVIIK